MEEYEGKYLVKAPNSYYYKGKDAFGFNHTTNPKEALIFEDRESAEQLAHSLNNIAEGLSRHIAHDDIYYAVARMHQEVVSYSLRYGRYGWEV